MSCEKRPEEVFLPSFIAIPAFAGIVFFYKNSSSVTESIFVVDAGAAIPFTHYSHSPILFDLYKFLRWRMKHSSVIALNHCLLRARCWVILFDNDPFWFPWICCVHHIISYFDSIHISLSFIWLWKWLPGDYKFCITHKFFFFSIKQYNHSV